MREGVLAARYVFARDVFGRPMLPGGAEMCVGMRRFVMRGERDCLVRGFERARFHEVDTWRSVRWTLFLGQPG